MSEENNEVNKLAALRNNILRLTQWCESEGIPPAVLFFELDQMRIERTFESMYRFYEEQRKPSLAEKMGID